MPHCVALGGHSEVAVVAFQMNGFGNIQPCKDNSSDTLVSLCSRCAVTGFELEHDFVAGISE